MQAYFPHYTTAISVVTCSLNEIKGKLNSLYLSSVLTPFLRLGRREVCVSTLCVDKALDIECIVDDLAIAKTHTQHVIICTVAHTLDLIRVLLCS